MRGSQDRQAPDPRSDEQLRATDAMSAIVQDAYGDADVLRLEGGRPARRTGCPGSIDRTYPLDRVPEAMRHLEAGQVRGKVAITI